MMLNPPVRQTTADAAEAALFEAIMDGTIPPGAPLRLQELAGQLGMSMMPIREAVRRLQGLGLVEVVAHKGAWVRPLTHTDLYDTYFTRIHLETVAVRDAAALRTDAVIEQARGALDDQHAADARGDLLASRDAHERFHFALYEASGSSWLVRSIWPVWRNSERYRVESMRNPEHVARRAGEHTKMLKAMEDGDGDAAVKLLVSHLTSSCDLVASSLEVEPGEQVKALPTAVQLLVPSRGKAAPRGGKAAPRGPARKKRT